MKLVDTSAWVHQMRPKGEAEVRARVEGLLRAGEAAWCAMVRLEIWAGVGDERERKILGEYEAVLPELSIDDRVWRTAYDLARRARRSGRAIPSTDILIFACARSHGVEVEHADDHFDMLAALPTG
ncbi:MAG: PIN domain-containing protein [Myxococcales bacterium]|nr:PIN domain-containing protein [Myxococcales bacterium]